MKAVRREAPDDCAVADIPASAVKGKGKVTTALPHDPAALRRCWLVANPSPNLAWEPKFLSKLAAAAAQS
jgi:hypothetical protein